MAEFPNIDLNLLKLFASLYQTASVTQTAEQLKLSQSACSHALTRLRERLGDDLFIRVDNKMLPTAYAQHLADQVIPSLNTLAEALHYSDSFTPLDSHTFHIAVTDYTAWSMRKFVAWMSEHYPAIHVVFKQLEERLPEQALAAGELDFVAGFSHQEEMSEALETLVWFEDRYVCGRCAAHPLQGEVSLDAFLSFPHILVTPWNESRGIVDLALAKAKKKRQVGLKMASVLGAPHFLPGSPYLLSVPAAYAEMIKQQIPLAFSELPLVVPDYRLQLYWHKLYRSSPKMTWFIEQFRAFYL
ncbi:LysR family transcriptional regulator [Thaumasiovibrio subtropicus]|uniref:LysR family transcriptional regulator n=1 Tax=Thaumasiovibrio subtropicus TaxID=1891207 RepID=UPI000B34AF79|nr:LysR family transcriptional regulator [Thaumasiovibrio subtropicus]